MKKELTKPKKKLSKHEENKKTISKRIIIFYIILLLINITMIIYSARHNYVNYVSLPGNERILISKNEILLFGRNYIALIITAFFSIYTLLFNKYLLKLKNTKKLSISTLLFYLILNIFLFYIFNKKIF